MQFDLDQTENNQLCTFDVCQIWLAITDLLFIPWYARNRVYFANTPI